MFLFRLKNFMNTAYRNFIYFILLTTFYYLTSVSCFYFFRLNNEIVGMLCCLITVLAALLTFFSLQLLQSSAILLHLHSISFQFSWSLHIYFLLMQIFEKFSVLFLHYFFYKNTYRFQLSAAVRLIFFAQYFHYCFYCEEKKMRLCRRQKK